MPCWTQHRKKREELARGMEVEGSLGHSDIEMLVRANSRITTLDLKKAACSGILEISLEVSHGI